MNRLSLALTAMVLTACSGEAKDQGGDVADDITTPAGDPQGVLVVTDNTETPWITVGTTGTVIVAHADPLGRPSGLTVMHGDGRTGVLGIDPETGHPTHWVSDGYVWTFSNVRPELGLLDVGLIAPDGATGQIKDLQVPPVVPAVPSSARFFMSVDDGRKLAEAIGALGVGVNLTVCVGSAILTTGGAVVGTLTFPPAAVPLFETSVAATSAACAGAVIALMALRPENTTAVRINDALGTKDEIAGVAEMVEAVAECAEERATWECLQAAAAVVDFASSETLKTVLEHYIRLRDRAAVGVPYQVYCCSGPTQVKVGDHESWRASVIEGLGKLPFTYQWSFGDNDDETWLRSEQYGLTLGHTYYEPRTYAVKVKVRDAALNEVQSNATATGPLSTFFVEAYAPLGAECCGGPLRGDPGVELRLDVQIIGGRAPFRIALDTGDGATLTGYIVGRFIPLSHTYEEPGDYLLRLTVTDADGTAFTAEPDTVTVGPPDDPIADPDPADTTPADTTPADTGPQDTTPPDPIEWVVWRPTTVGCWDAPQIYVTLRSGYEAPQAYCNTPYGGVDCSQNIEKTLLQGGFANDVEATAWVCPQLSCYFNHNWCPPHFLMGDKWVLASNLGCADIPVCVFP